MSNKKTIYLGMDYSDFTGGVTEINRKMKLLDAEFKLAQEQSKNYGNQIESLGIQHDVLSQKILLQKQKVEQASKAYDAAVSSNKATQKEIDNLDKKLLDERTALEKLNNQLNKVNEAYQTLENDTLSITDKMELLESSFKNVNSIVKINASENEKLKVTQEYLIQKIELQKQKLEEARNAYEKATSSGEVNKKTVNKLTIAYNEEQTKLNELNNELAETNNKLNDSNKKTESFGDTIRGLANNLGLEASPAVEMFASKFDNVNKHVGNTILGIGTLASTLAKTTIETSKLAGEIDELSHKTGMSTDTIQELNYAAEYLEISAEDIGSSIAKMTKNMDTARTGTGDAAEAFNKLGVRIKDTRGNLRDSQEVFYDVIDALGKVRNSTEKDALSLTIFGRSAMDLNNLILEGSDGLKGYAERAHEIGYVMDNETIQSFNRLDDAMTEFGKVGDALQNSMATALLPMLTGLFEAISKIPTPVLQTLVVLASVITTIVLLVKAIKSVTDTGKTIKSFFDVTNASTLKTTAIILGVVAALVALATIIAVIAGKSGELQQSMASVGNSVGSITDTVSNTQSNYRTIRNNYRGTKSYEGGATMVGEEGRPELVVPPKGSRIYNADETEAILNGSGDTFIIKQILIDPKNIKEITDIFKIVQGQKTALRRGVRTIV